MPTVLRFRRGDTTASNAFTGAEGELFIDTSKDTVVVHDGVTAGGKPLATEAALTSGLAGKADTSALSSYATTSELTSGLAGKQSTLVSGTNIKTVNGTSLLGSGNIVISGGGGGGDLTQVASDITPLIDDVYDIGSSTSRFYDAYLGNKLDISGASVTGTATLITPEVQASSTSTNIPHIFLDGVFYNGNGGNIGSGPGSISVYFNIQQQPAAAAFVSSGTWLRTQSFKLTAMGGPNGLEEYTFTGLSPAGGGGGDNFSFNYTSVSPALPSMLTYNYMDWMMNMNLYRYVTKSEFIEVQTTVIPYSPAVYDYTLASNASLVAPTVVANTSLIGGLYTEGTTITPEHTLGAYTDVKGVLTVDGSLTVKDDLNVRNSIVLKQELVSLGKVVSKSSTPSSQAISTYSTQLNNFSALGYAFGYFYGNGADVYTYSAFTSEFTSAFAAGNIVRIAKTFNTQYDLWWDLQIISATPSGSSYSLSYNVVGVSPTANVYGWSQPQYYSSNFDVGNGIQFTATIITPAKYILQLDKNATVLDNSVKIGLNGSLTSAPVTSNITLSGNKSTFGIYDTGNNANQYSRYITLSNGSGTWTSPISQAAIDMKAMFANGNQVTITWNGYASVYAVSNANISSDMFQGADMRLNFNLSFVSGSRDFAAFGEMDYAFGMMGQSFTWAATVISSISYTSYRSQFVSSTVAGTTYSSTSNWDWVNIGDALQYIPSTSALKFTKDDGTSVKAISYNNLTGALTYDGMPDQYVMISSVNGNIYSNNARSVNNPSDGNSVLNPNNGTNGVAIGLNASVSGGSVSIGSNATSAGGSITIGESANSGYQGIAIGKDTSGGNNGNYGIGIGMGTKAYASKGISLGYNLASTVSSVYSYYALPNLIMTPKTRDVIITSQHTGANQYIYMNFMGDNITLSSSAQTFSLKDLLNFSAYHAMITLEYNIGTNSTDDYWASGIKRYRFNDYLSTNKLTELTAPVTAQYGTATYANNLSVALANSNGNQTLQVLTNASDTTQKLVTIKLSVALFNLA